MRIGTLIFIACGVLSTACAGHNSGAVKQNDKLALELADLRSASRAERVKVRDLEKQLALNAAALKAKDAEDATVAATVEQDRPTLPVEVRTAPELQSEQDLPDGYDAGQFMGVNDEGVEIIYVGEAASDKVVVIPPNHYLPSVNRGESSVNRGERSNDDHLYDDEPARPRARRSAARERLALEPVPVVADVLSVTSGIPTIDSQLRQARQPLPLPRVRTRRFGDPRAEYHRYYEALRAGNHSYALTGFRNFVERFPTHDFADNAQYWIGETFYDQRRFKSALLEFRKVVDNHPDGNKVPDGLLKLGYCYYELGELSKAKQVWQQVVQLYPKSNPAILARTKISTLED